MIKHARITLRHLTEADLPLFIQYRTDPVALGPHNPSRMANPQAVRKRFAEDGFSTDERELLLVCDEHGAVIGHVQHFVARAYSSAREIGWYLYSDAHRGRGYATEAVTALVDYLFNSFPINRIECCTARDNLASVRLAQRCGFTQEGVMRGMAFVGGRYIDDLLLSLLRSEWERARAAR